MRKGKLPYAEGTWFAVPLPTGGFGVGRVARCNGRGEVFGYFFGPRWSTIPKLEKTSELKPEDAILRRMFGDLGLVRGSWAILGTPKDWRREDWPMPPLLYIDDISGKAWLRYYDENALGPFLRQNRCDPSEHLDAPRDGLSGKGALETWFDKALIAREFRQ